MTNFTKIAKEVESGVERFAIHGVDSAILTVPVGLILANAHGGGTLIGDIAIPAAFTALGAAASSFDDFLDHHKEKKMDEKAKEIKDSEHHYAVYGDMKNLDAPITLVDKDKPKNYMVMSMVKDDFQDSVSPKYLTAAFPPNIDEVACNQLISVAQARAKQEGVSLKLPPVSSLNIAGELQTVAKGNVIHLPLTENQESQYLKQPNKDENDRYSSFNIDSQKPTTARAHYVTCASKFDVTKIPDEAKHEEPKEEVDFKDGKVDYNAYSGPSM